MSKFFQQVTAYIENGFSVFPLIMRTKRPATSHGFKDATNDLEKCKEWSDEPQSHNVGIATGTKSNLAVIDIDPKNGGLESLEKMKSQYGFNPENTPTVVTGSGGFHFYYDCPYPIGSRNGILPGVDIKADGGYVVAPPSIHPNGKAYTFLDENTHLAQRKPFPMKVIDEINLSKLENGRPDADGGTIKEGGRHDHLVSLGGKLRGRGFDKEAIAEALHAENASYCNPPVDIGEVDRIVASFKERPMNEVLMYAPMTDLGNAERFKAMYTGKAMFITKMNKWFFYDGKRFVEDTCQVVVQMTKELLRKCQELKDQFKDESLQKFFIKHLKKSESNGKVNALLDLAESEMPINPDQLDSDPYLFNVLNGTVNLKIGELLTHSGNHKISKLASVNFDPRAACPVFQRFMGEITCGDVDLARYIQKVIGYCLTGLANEQYLWVLHGLGSNGKTTFIETIKKIIGEYGRSADISTFTYKQSEQIRNDLARLFDARVVTSVEAQEGKRLDESVVKQVTGGDPVTCRFLFKEHFEYIPKFKLFMVVNHLPHINGTDRGIWRRIKVIPFAASFEGKNKDKDLLQKLDAELSGILNWAIQGCLLWQKEGLSEPTAVQAAGKKYQEDEDTLEDFLSEFTEREAGRSIAASQLFSLYSERQKEFGAKVMSIKVFSQKLAIKGIEKERGTGGRVYYMGLKEKGPDSNSKF